MGLRNELIKCLIVRRLSDVIRVPIQDDLE